MKKKQKILNIFLVLICSTFMLLGCNNKNVSTSDTPKSSSSKDEKTEEVSSNLLYNLEELNKLHEYYFEALEYSEKNNEPYSISSANLKPNAYEVIFKEYKTTVKENDEEIKKIIDKNNSKQMIELNEINEEYLKIEAKTMYGFTEYSKEKNAEFKEKYDDLKARISKI